MSAPLIDEECTADGGIPNDMAPTADTQGNDPLPTNEDGGAQDLPTDAQGAGSSEEPPVDYARLASEDLAEIKRLDPAYAPASHLSELPFAARFAELRDLGLTVREALAAAAPRFARTDGRAHLRAVAPHGAKAPPEGLAPSDMKNARALFNGLSDSEINALYRRVTQKHND